jgi:hypothetical protein
VPVPSAERALRRLVLSLSRASPDDIVGVLSELDADQRILVETMLAQYRGHATPTPLADAEPLLAGLSPWLSERLTHADRSRAGRSDDRGPSRPVADMTPAATGALRSSAMELLDLGLATPAPLAAKARLSTLLERLTAKVLARPTLASWTLE